MAAVADAQAVRRAPLHFVTTDDAVEICYQDVRPVKTLQRAKPAVAEPPVLVFQHGYTSYRGTWFNVVAKLRAKYRCIMLDMRGCGFSARPAQASAYSIPRLVEDVMAVVNAAGVDKFIYIGHSLGGGMGFQMALSQHAVEAVSFGIVEPPLTRSAQARLVGMVLVTPINSTGLQTPASVHEQDIRRREQFSLSRYKEFKRAMLTRPEHVDADEEEFLTAVSMDLKLPRVYYDTLWDAMIAFRADASAITTPTLMVTADCDGLMAANLKDYRSLQRAQLHVFSRVTHSVPREVPFELAGVIDDFVRHGVQTIPDILTRVPAFDAALKSKL